MNLVHSGLKHGVALPFLNNRPEKQTWIMGWNGTQMATEKNHVIVTIVNLRKTAYT